MLDGAPESRGWYIFNGPFSGATCQFFFTPNQGGSIGYSYIGSQNSWGPHLNVAGGDNSTLVDVLADENNVIQIRFDERNTDIYQLKFAGTENAVLEEWLEGGIAGDSCKYSQVWPFTGASTVFTYVADALPAECLPGVSDGGLSIDCGGIGMNITVPDYTLPSGQGKALGISQDPELWGLDQYTWAVVT